MRARDDTTIWEILQTVADPEIPALSVVDLGIVRHFEWVGDALEVMITPTYSGCPAMTMIEKDIVKALDAHGIRSVVRRVLSPAWTSTWLTESARQKLAESGIAPPGSVQVRISQAKITCPYCGSAETELISEFGSTACKALARCRSCGSPFDSFKPI
jgi:ring-1,2-phenylacetyl-CoA epoxidase subunit PaaD